MHCCIKLAFHNRQPFFGKYLRKLCSVKLISAATIFAVSHMCTGIMIPMCVCVCARASVVVRILRFDATARRHICRNVRLAHRTGTAYTAHMHVLSLSLATRTHDPQIFSYFFLCYSICRVCISQNSQLPRMKV